MNVPQRLSLVTLGVTDVARATSFYESLGWQRADASQPTITFFAMQGSALALFERSALAADAAVDPDGHLWEIAYNPFSPNDPAGLMTMS